MGRRHAGLFFLSFMAEDAVRLEGNSLQSTGEFASANDATSSVMKDEKKRPA
jgi:hypothetical protein